MKALVFPGDRRVRIAELPVPEPGRGEALVGVTASGICGTDLHKYREPASVRGAAAGIATGHEPVGEVAAVGEGVDAALVGRRVVVWHIWGCRAPDGPCTDAVLSRGMFCSHTVRHGATEHGANAQYHLAPSQALLPLPEDLDDAVGVLLACNLGTAWSGIGKLDLGPAARVGVWGLGTVGLSAVLCARAAGATVSAVDPLPERRDRALDLGAEDALDPAALRDGAWVAVLGGPLDAAVDTTGARGVQSLLPQVVRHGGQVLLLGLGTGTGVDRTNLITLKELVIRGSLVFHSDDWGRLVAFARGHPEVRRLVSHRCSWREAEREFADADAGAGAGKPVFDWIA